jgi:hypothetical protein
VKASHLESVVADILACHLDGAVPAPRRKEIEQRMQDAAAEIAALLDEAVEERAQDHIAELRERLWGRE